MRRVGKAQACPPFPAPVQMKVGTARSAPLPTLRISLMTLDEFIAAALRNPANKTIVDGLFHLALPDAWLVSGCLVQTVWNVITGRAVDYGIAEYDVFYFDRDTSWEAEDNLIRRLDAAFRNLSVKIEARNQARVHLWYPDKHGL